MEKLAAVDLSFIVSLARILFATIFFAKTWVSLDARQLVWCHFLQENPQRESRLKALLRVQLVLLTLLAIGLWTTPVALLLFGLYVYLNRQASLYGLEDVVFQATALYFALTTHAATHWSLDAWLGTTVLTWDAQVAPLAELALLTILGVVFLSAGREKLRSRMWMRGLGAYYFFLLPQFRRASTKIFTSNRLLIVFINYSAIFMQLTVLVFFALDFRLSLLSWFFATSFSVALSTLFVLTWIGECMVVALAIVFFFLIQNADSNLILQWNALLQDPSPLLLTMMVAVGFTLFSTVWTALASDALWLKPFPFAMRLHLALRRLSRFTWGIVPLKVFTETHIEGPVVFKMICVGPSGQRSEPLEIFTQKCSPGRHRTLRPSFFEVTSYKVAEACMELDAFGKIESTERESFILAMSNYVAGKSLKNWGFLPEKIECLVSQIVAPPEFQGAVSKWFEDASWVHAFDIEFVAGRAQRVIAVTRPILKAPTGRDIKRLSFKFNPASN